MLDGFGLVHMNGRIYDSELGRFLQADPLIQEPRNTQSWNAYTYVFNNPLVYIDPTGMISWKKIWRPLVAIAVSVVTYGAASGWAAGWLAGTGR
jgi:RHS repeat-associated protein